MAVWVSTEASQTAAVEWPSRLPCRRRRDVCVSEPASIPTDVQGPLCPWCDSPARSEGLENQPAWRYRCQAGCRFVLDNPTKVAVRNLGASDPARCAQVRAALAALCQREPHDFRVDSWITAADWWLLNEKLQMERMPPLCRCFDDFHAHHPGAPCNDVAAGSGLCPSCTVAD